MTQLSLPPSIERLALSPQLTTLAILDAALSASESALLAAHPDIPLGTLCLCERGSAPMRAHSILIASRRLASALAAYRKALDKQQRLVLASRQRVMPF